MESPSFAECGLRWICLLCGDGAERGKDRGIDAAPEIQKFAVGLLDEELAVFVEDRCAILADRKLLPRAVPDGNVSVRRFLSLGRARGPEFDESFGAVARHGQVDLSLLIIPIERDSDILVALPVGRDLVLFLVCKDTY